MKFNNRITKVIEYSQLTPAEFAEEIGVQRSSISHIISGRNKPSLDFITKIKYIFPKINWEWLITGNGEMLIVDVPLESSEDSKKEKEEKKKSSIPDLFSMIIDDDFGVSKSEIKDESLGIPEVKNYDVEKERKTTSNSQTLEKRDMKSKKIKQIVFFYDDGSFETFQN